MTTDLRQRAEAALARFDAWNQGEGPPCNSDVKWLAAAVLRLLDENERLRGLWDLDRTAKDVFQKERDAHLAARGNEP